MDAAKNNKPNATTLSGIIFSCMTYNRPIIRNDTNIPPIACNVKPPTSNDSFANNNNIIYRINN